MATEFFFILGFTMEGVTTALGHIYIVEDIELVKKRNAIAAGHLQAGLTYKHAWFKAFQEYPRATSPSSPNISAACTCVCHARLGSDTCSSESDSL